MTLDYTSSAVLAASLRMRIDALPPTTPVLVVEGTSDRTALARVIHPRVVLVPASNKEKALGARTLLTAAELVRFAFLVDCDGDVTASWRGSPEIIVSDQRDLDADAAVAMGALRTALQDFLAPRFETGHKLTKEVDRLLTFLLAVTSFCGIVTDRARTLGVPIRIAQRSADGSTAKRRIRPDDLDHFISWAKDLTAPSGPRDVADAIASQLDWSIEQTELVAASINKGGQKECRRHGAASCQGCATRTFVNGHDLLAVARSALVIRCGITVAPIELQRLMRVSIDSAMLSSWSVRRRLSTRGSQTGFQYI